MPVELGVLGERQSRPEDTPSSVPRPQGGAGPWSWGRLPQERASLRPLIPKLLEEASKRAVMLSNHFL